MKTKWRILLGSALGCAGISLAFLSVAAPHTRPAGRLKLAAENLKLRPNALATNLRITRQFPSRALALGGPTFGNPVISGIGGTGFEEDLRLDPSNPNRLYTSVPGTLSADTSWIWRSLDGGRTFKWIPNATALEGKVAAPCSGGGDTELGVDPMGRLYFCD